MIEKLPNGEYRLYSRKKDPKTGKRRNLGTFKSRAAAQQHEKQVQYFKSNEARACHSQGMAAKRIQELTIGNALEGVAREGGTDIDEKNGVIHNVVICGLQSANNRRYPADVLRRDCRKYEGAKVNFDHSTDSRKFAESGGWLSNVKIAPDGRPRGSLNLYLSDPLTPKVFEAARRNPNGFGLSHVAMCHTRYEGGVEIVESIEAIESVDIVTDPATVGGLFESKQSKGNRVGFKVKDLIPWVVKHPKSTTEQIVAIKKLCEEDSGMYANADMSGLSDAGPAESTEPDDAIADALKSALTSLFDKVVAGELDKDAFLEKVEGLIDLHCGEEDPPAGGGGNPNDKPQSESKRKKGQGQGGGQPTPIEEALDVCEKLKFRADRADLNIIANTAKEQRESVAKRLQEASEGKGGGGERPQSHGRHQIAESEGKNGKGGNANKEAPPTDAKKFREWVED